MLSGDYTVGRRLSTIGRTTPEGAERPEAADALDQSGGAAPAPRVMTVDGPLAPGELGVTLVHEHLILDGACFFEDGGDGLADVALTADNAARVRAASCSNRDNLRLDDPALAAAELGEYSALGGRTVVDVTSSAGLGRDPQGLRALARATSLRVVMGCGFYCEYSYPDFVLGASADALAELIVRDLREGVDGVQAGVIGEIGVNGQERGTLRHVGEMTDAEEASLRAACRASLDTGAAMVVHQPNRASAVPAIIAVLESEQVDPARVVLAHMSSVPDFAAHLHALDRGYWIAYDNFGMALANRWYRPIDDAQRIDWLLALFARGLGGRVLVSHDVWCKLQLRRYGGGGYGHILRSIVPALRERGLSADDVRRLLVDNPAEVLAF
jgi:phosphotriesterase-related protein